MKRLMLKLAVAAPLVLVMLLLPFAASYLLARIGVHIPSFVTVGAALGLSMLVFFRIVGPDMRRVDDAYRSKRGHSK